MSVGILSGICLLELVALLSLLTSGAVGDRVCNLPKKAGNCRGSLSRYYYDNKENKCKEFTFSGCRGNKNRFASASECSKRCGNTNGDNQVSTDNQVPSKCMASSKPSSYTCYAILTRYRYNNQTKQCEKFTYGGCGGGSNVFSSQSQCETECNVQMSTVDKVPNKCIPPPKPSTSMTISCYASIPSYRYNKQTKQCEKFIYGGCGGDSNRFSSQVECETECNVEECEDKNDYCKYWASNGECAKNPAYMEPNCCLSCSLANNVPSKCLKPSTSGTRFCKGYFPRYRYNKKKMQCEKFIYGGCGATSNMFPTEAQCETQCMK